MILRFIDCGITKLKIHIKGKKLYEDTVAYYFPKTQPEEKRSYFFWKYVPYRDGVSRKTY